MKKEMNRTTLPAHQLSDSNRQIVDPNAPSVRLYQAWKGSNIFLLGGRLIFGPDVRSLYLTVFLIVAPVILFCSFVSQSLVNQFPNHMGRVVVAIPAALTAYILILILLVSGRDPGIIPRNSQPPEPDDECDTSSISTEWAGSQSGAPYLPPTKSVNVNGMIIRVKYCQTCMLYRPPRCSHCSICNNCVERFDHHCPWVGQCIGKRNYRYFFMFVSSTTLLCFYVFIFCWVNVIMVMKSKHCNLWKAFVECPVSGILIMYTFTVSWFVGGLSAFHLYLVITNQTTYENFRYRYDRRMNPYNHGCARNFKDVLFSRIPSSKNNFRAMVKVDSFCHYKSSRYLGRAISAGMVNTSFRMEIGKQHAVDGNEFEDAESQFRSVRGSLERCGTQPYHKNNWEMTPDSHKSASEFEKEHATRDKEKMNGGSLTVG